MFFTVVTYVTLDICVSFLATVTIIIAVTYVTLVTCVDSAPAHYTTRVLPVQRVVNLHVPTQNPHLTIVYVQLKQLYFTKVQIIQLFTF